MTMLLNSQLTVGSIQNILILSVCAIILGYIMTKVHGYRNKTSKNFAMTLAILPLTIQLVILLVNGNVGTGVAVMGAFSLVRFRSMPGTSKEIGSIFATMAVGLALGTGQIIIAVLFTIIYAIVVIGYEKFNIFGKTQEETKVQYQQLSITVPEDLYTPEVFTSILKKYTNSFELANVKTSNMGSMFKLKYIIVFNEQENVKQFLNELRCRNGNLDINFNYIVEESKNNNGL